MGLPSRESLAYMATLAKVHAWAANYSNRKEWPVSRAFIDGDIMHELGEGTCYDFEYDDFKAMKDLIENAIKDQTLHPDTIRFFEGDGRVVVRRPNCDACGDLFSAHANDGKCLFASTNFNDAG